jgi:hypothetical protein
MVQYFFGKANFPLTIVVGLIVMAWLSLFSVIFS